MPAPRLSPTATLVLAVLLDQPMHPYEMLVRLRKRRDDRLVRLNPGAVYHAVDRLERDGLVERVSCADDARGAYARLTDAGRAKLHAASATHLEAVRVHFLDHFSPEELSRLAESWDRVAGPAAALHSCS